MSSISCPLLSNTLTNVFSFHDDVYTGNEIFNIKMDEEQFFLEKKNGINKVLNELCKYGWVNPSANYQDTNLHNLLSSLAETSLVERIVSFNNALKCGLPPGYNATFCFEGNGQSGVKMHYGVVHSDGDCDLFKLTCDFLFDKHCQLSHEKSFISIECFPQCPKALEDALDSRTVIKKFLDWLMNLFNLNGFVFDSTQSDADIVKNIAVSFSKININQDNSADCVIENRDNEKREGDFNQSLQSIFDELDKITNYIDNELDECSENKIKQMITKLSSDLENGIKNDKEDLEQIEIGTVNSDKNLVEIESNMVEITQILERIESNMIKITQIFEAINGGFEHSANDDFEWDDSDLNIVI